MSVFKNLSKVQNTLHAPKNQYNSFGKYNYRSCEDIVEAVKPLCAENGLVLLISDKIIQVGDRTYVESTASVTNFEDGEKIQVTAQAREAETQKGMNVAQITGSSSSYARKYALNGLFGIDDTKDPDTKSPDNNKPDNKKPTQNKPTNKPTTNKPSAADKAKADLTIQVRKGVQELMKSKGVTEAQVKGSPDLFGLETKDMNLEQLERLNVKLNL